MQAGRVRQALRLGIIAGAAGGLAEIIWIASYGMLTGRDTTVVAHSITDVIGMFGLADCSRTCSHCE